MVLDPHMGGSLVLIANRVHKLHHLTVLAAFGRGLKKLAGCDGFGVLMRELENLPQFDDAMFEVACASHFASHSSVRSIRLHPQYQVRGHLKVPDFDMDVLGGIGRVVCECKSANENARRYSQQLDQVMKILSQAIEGHGGLPEDARLEIHIAAPRRSPPKDIANRIAKWLAKRPAFGEINQFGEFSVCVKQKGSGLTFDERDYLQGQFTISDKPQGILSVDADLLLSVASLSDRRATSLGRLLNTAKAQLPPDRPCLIILQTTGSDVNPAIVAAQRRLRDAVYRHVRGLVIEGGGQTKIVHRPGDKLIHALFPDTAGVP
jgi:hypothetical protein